MFTHDTLARISSLVHDTVATAATDGFHLAVAVVDGGGHELLYVRDPQARLITTTTAVGKARCAILFDRSTDKTVEVAEAHPLAFTTFAAASDVKFVIGRGGEVVTSGADRLAVGVAGANGDRDAADAKHLADQIAALLAGDRG